MANTRLVVEIIGEKPAKLDLAPTRRAAATVCEMQKELNLPGGIVNVMFVDEVAMRELNLKFSGNDYATDVLSFNYLESGEAIEGVIGEIALASSIAQQQAEVAGTSWADECALLVVHGLLHLAGFDHQTSAQQQQVQAMQRTILNKANVEYRAFTWQD